MRNIAALLGVWILFWCPEAEARRQAANPIDALKPGEWYEVPNSHMIDVAPTFNQFPGTWGAEGPSAVMNDWAGGAFDSKRDRLYVTGGGHGGYFGNEIYSFALNSLTWSRLNEPSPLVFAYNPDWAYPTSTHTYHGLEYLPSVDRFLEQGFPNSTGYTGDISPGYATYLFDPATLQWQKKSKYPYNGNEQRTGALSAYDSATGMFFYHTCFTGQLSSYDAATDTWKGYGYGTWVDYYLTAAIDPKRRKFVALGYNKLIVWDISDLTKTISSTTPATTGDTQILSANNPGFEYDPVVDKLVAWNGGTDVYTLDMDTMVWTRRAAAATNTATPTAKNSNGTYGRFRYIPSKNAYVLANRTGDNVFLYKLSAGSGSPTTPPPTTPPPTTPPPTTPPPSGSS